MSTQYRITKLLFVFCPPQNGSKFMNLQHKRHKIANRPPTDTRLTLPFIGISCRPTGNEKVNSQIIGGATRNEIRSPITITLDSSVVTTTPNTQISFSSPCRSRNVTPVNPLMTNSNADFGRRARPSTFFLVAATFTIANQLWRSHSGWPRTPQAHLMFECKPVIFTLVVSATHWTAIMICAPHEER